MLTAIFLGTLTEQPTKIQLHSIELKEQEMNKSEDKDEHKFKEDKCAEKIEYL